MIIATRVGGILNQVHPEDVTALHASSWRFRRGRKLQAVEDLVHEASKVRLGKLPALQLYVREMGRRGMHVNEPSVRKQRFVDRLCFRRVLSGLF